MNVAVTEVLAVRFTLHVPVPEQPPPDQPPNVVPALGLAVSVTAVPLAKLALHVAPHVIPAGELLTVPVPLPDVRTDNWKLLAAAVLNVAVTEALAAAIMLHADVPLQAPDQPANVELAFGVAVSVIAVPDGKLALHVCPQLMPAGVLLTVPAPVPAATTLT